MRVFIAALFISVYALTAWSEVGITVWVGAGATVRTGATVPIVVQLQNDERNRTGVVAAGFTQGTLPQSWAAQPLSLAPHARKRVFLYLPFLSMTADRVVVRYETTSGSPLAVHEEPLQSVASTLPVVAAVGQLPPGLPDPEVKEKARYRGVILQPDLLPPRYEGLEMYDAILLMPTPDIPLEAEQVAALDDWILRGGTLVVDASRRSDGLQQADLRELLPFLPESSESMTVTGFNAPLFLAKGTVQHGKALLTVDGLPLIVRRNYGLGSVVCFAFNPGEPGFVTYPQREALWKDILGAIDFEEQPRESWNYMGPGTVDSLMRRVSDTGGAPTRLGLVVLLTVLYALAVGPGDYFLVKRLRKPWMTWITFPAMALAFSAVAYGGARIWFGGETVSRAVHHVTVLPEAQKSLSFDAAGLFAGQSDTYSIRHAHQALWRPLQGLFDPDQSLVIDPESAEIRQRIPVWSHRVYIAGETTSEGVDVRISLEGEARDDMRVENRSPYNLRDCFVYYGDLQGTCGLLEAGETLSIHLTKRAPTYVPGAMDEHGKPAQIPMRVDTCLYPSELVVRPNRMDAPLARELFAGDALRRGALVLIANAGRNEKSRLVVNGTQRTENTEMDLAVVTYGSASE
jgi:hypothetical protein